MCVVSTTQIEISQVMIGLYEWPHRTFPAWADCRSMRAQLFLKEAGLEILERKEQSMWGLAVEILLAKRPL
jgi:hypothetical protein